MSGPTTVPLSAVLQVTQTLTTMGPLGTLARAASTNAKSAESRSAFSRSITGSHHGRQATSFVGSRRRLIAIGSLPSGAPRPDDASKAQFVMAGLLARGSLPSAAFPGIPSGIGLGLVAYSCGGSAGIERTRTGFPFHLPRGRTIADVANRRGGWGQPLFAITVTPKIAAAIGAS